MKMTTDNAKFSDFLEKTAAFSFIDEVEESLSPYQLKKKANFAISNAASSNQHYFFKKVEIENFGQMPTVNPNNPQLMTNKFSPGRFVSHAPNTFSPLTQANLQQRKGIFQTKVPL